MLVTFEGLDGSGKSSLMHAVAVGLRSQLSEHVTQLPDISQSPTGHRLKEVFGADSLFGQGIAAATVTSRCLATAADLLYFDAALIAPMVAAGGIVLKERHVDTLFSHQGPALAARLNWPEQRAHQWLTSVVGPLQVWPQLTILVEAPRAHRERRLRERSAAQATQLGGAELAIDRAVFRIRARWYAQLRSQDENRWVSIANPDGGLSRAASQAIAEIIGRHADHSPLPAPGKRHSWNSMRRSRLTS